MTQSIDKRETYPSSRGGARCISEGIDQIKLDRKAAKAVERGVNELGLSTSSSSIRTRLSTGLGKFNPISSELNVINGFYPTKTEESCTNDGHDPMNPSSS